MDHFVLLSQGMHTSAEREGYDLPTGAMREVYLKGRWTAEQHQEGPQR